MLLEFRTVAQNGNVPIARLSAVLSQIHVAAPTPPFLLLGERAKGPWSSRPVITNQELIEKAARVTKWLVDEEPAKTVLLHGDFHPQNVLVSANGQSVVIDPMPLVGDAAYDLAQIVGNECRANPSGIRDRLRVFSQAFCLDHARIAGWAFVKTVGTGNWKEFPHVAQCLCNAVFNLRPAISQIGV